MKRRVASFTLLLYRIVLKNCMKPKKLIRNLIIGNNRFVSSYGEYKQAMLSGHIALMGILIVTFYAISDHLMGIYHIWPLYLGTVFFLGFSIYLHRRSSHKMANYVLLPTINLAVYLFSSSEAPEVGSWIFFLSNSVAALAVFT